MGDIITEAIENLEQKEFRNPRQPWSGYIDGYKCGREDGISALKELQGKVIAIDDVNKILDDVFNDLQRAHIGDLHLVHLGSAYINAAGSFRSAVYRKINKEG